MRREDSVGAVEDSLSSSARQGATSPGHPEAWVGRVLDGRYELSEVIGEGGFGVVYRAKHRTLNRDVAIKVLVHSGGGDPMARARFEREAAMLATLSHPHIVTVTDFGIADGTPYLVMELVTGRSLRAMIDGGELDFERAIGIALQVLKALAYAHEQGIVHRDLKPMNVVVQSLSGEDHIKLFDFGFAKFFGDAEHQPGNALTARGTAVGTAGYIAPEQLGSIAVDGRADLFAVAVLLFEMITGRRPFQQADGSSIEELRATLLSTPPPLASLRPELALVPDLDAWMSRGLAKDPNERFASALEMARELEQVLSQGAESPVSREAMPSADEGPPPATVVHDAPTPVAIPPEAPPPAAYVRPERDALAHVWERSTSPNLWMLAGMVVLPAALFALVVGTVVSFVRGSIDDDEIQESASVDEPPVEEASSEEPLLLGPPVGDRPTPADPWEGSVPSELAELRDRLNSGGELRPADRRMLEQRARNEPWDARPHLLVAYAEREKGTSIAAIAAYERAYRASPASRGDRAMLRDLLVLTTHADVGLRAANAVVTIYGPEALPALDRTIEAARIEPRAQARLIALRDRVAR